MSAVTAADGESPAPLLLDISRLIWRARRRGPSGIDRIELAYAQHFLAEDAARPAYAVIHLQGWLFGVNPTGARHFVAAAARRWQGHGHPLAYAGPIGVLALYSKLLMGGWMAGFQLRRRLAG